ncbi:MAG: hypothetical protein AAGJ46_18075, partial [Planctomycetota bacterium]
MNGSKPSSWRKRGIYVSLASLPLAGTGAWFLAPEMATSGDEAAEAAPAETSLIDSIVAATPAETPEPAPLDPFLAAASEPMPVPTPIQQVAYDQPLPVARGQSPEANPLRSARPVEANPLRPAPLPVDSDAQQAFGELLAASENQATPAGGPGVSGDDPSAIAAAAYEGDAAAAAGFASVE